MLLNRFFVFTLTAVQYFHFPCFSPRQELLSKLKVRNFPGIFFLKNLKQNF